MIWKVRQPIVRVNSRELGIEITAANASSYSALEIQSSESSFEIVFDDVGKSYHVQASEEKCVRFSGRDSSITIESRHDLSDQERDAVWFRRRELKHMRERSERGRDEDRDEHGDPTNNCDFQEALHHHMAVGIVLEEQVRQRNEGYYDPELISLKYQAFLRRSRHTLFISNLVRKETESRGQVKPLPIINDADVIFSSVQDL